MTNTRYWKLRHREKCWLFSVTQFFEQLDAVVVAVITKRCQEEVGDEQETEWQAIVAQEL